MYGKNHQRRAGAATASLSANGTATSFGSSFLLSSSSVEMALSTALQELEMRSQVEACIGEMVRDVELSAHWTDRVRQAARWADLQDKFHSIEQAYLETRAMTASHQFDSNDPASAKKATTSAQLADKLAAELVQLSQVLGEFHSMKQNHQQLKFEHDQVLAQLVSAQRELQLVKEEVASRPQQNNDPSIRIETIKAADPTTLDGNEIMQNPVSVVESAPSATTCVESHEEEVVFAPAVVVLEEEEDVVIPQLHELERKILLQIFSYLDALDILNTAQINISMYSRVDTLYDLGEGEDEPIAGGEQAIEEKQVSEPSPVATSPGPPAAELVPSTGISEGTMVAIPPKAAAATKKEAPIEKPTSSVSQPNLSSTAAAPQAQVPVPAVPPSVNDKTPSVSATKPVVVPTVVQIPQPTSSSTTPSAGAAVAANSSSVVTSITSPIVTAPPAGTKSAPPKAATTSSTAASNEAPSSAAATAAAAAANEEGPRGLFSALLPSRSGSGKASPIRGGVSALNRSNSNVSNESTQAPPMTAAMANSIASKLSDGELNAIIRMTERLKQKESIADHLTRENEALTAKLTGTDSVKHFLIERVREMEQALVTFKEDDVKVAQQIASDQEVVAFLDGRVQELEMDMRMLSEEKMELAQELARVKEQAEQKSVVMGDMLQYERERLSESDREWRAAKKLLIKEVKNCRAQIVALQSERDGYLDQYERLRRAVLSSPSAASLSAAFAATPTSPNSGNYWSQNKQRVQA